MFAKLIISAYIFVIINGQFFSEAFYSLVLILFLAFGFGGFNQMMLKATNAQKQAFEEDSSERERRAYPVLEQYENDW